jgi:hypothetical protein
MKARLSAVSMIATFGLPLLVFSARGEEQSPPAPISDPARLKKQIAELEKRVAPLLKDLQDLQRQLDEQIPVTVIAAYFINPVQAGEIVERAFKDQPGVVVEALPKLKRVAIRANTEVTRQVKDLLERLDKAAMRAPKPFGGFQTGPTRLDDTTVVVVLAQWLKSRKPSER